MTTAPGGSAAAPRYFATPAEFRDWLAEHHASERELWVGFHKKDTGRPSLTWPESVDEALCAGWIDGIRKRVDGESYTIRFTPRRPTSIWSLVNLRRMEALLAEGRVLPAGRAAFAARQEAKTGVYAFEQRQAATLDAAAEERFRAHPAAWEFFQAQPAGYRKLMTWWVVSAKREETRGKRLGELIGSSARGERIPQMRPARASDTIC